MIKAKPILAIVCVCTAAGLLAWDVSYFMTKSRPASTARPATSPTEPGPTPTIQAAGPDDVAPDSDPAGQVPTGAGSEGAARGSPIDAQALSAQEPDFHKLFEQLVAQNASRAADEAPSVVPAVASPDTETAADSRAWDRLEFRGILADRVIAKTKAGRATRALRLHVFESPNRKVARAASNQAMTNQTTSTPASASTTTGASDGNQGGSSSGLPAATGGNNGARQ